MHVLKTKEVERFDPVKMEIKFETQEEYDYFLQFLVGATSPGYIETALAAADSTKLTEQKVQWVSDAINLIRAHLIS